MKLGVHFTPEGWDDFRSWNDNKHVQKKLDRLIEDIRRDPYRPGIGKPEMLSNDLAGYASRHIDKEHRLVYRVSGDHVLIITCRFHYTRK